MTTLHVSSFQALEDAVAHYQRALDLFVDRVRSRFPAAGAFIADEYQLTADQAEMFAAAGYSGTVPACVQSWADATGMSAQAAADNILATRDAYQQALAYTRRIRLVGKAEIAAAPDIRTAYEVFRVYRDQADAVQPPQEPST
jgi:hypothetical protein